jgi:4-hydroxy-2-oxoheptanedioate aldolase
VIELPVRAALEAYALAGFDFVVLDLEHSDLGLERLSTLLATCRAAGIASLVRIEAGGTAALTRVLDMHPDGVMVPGIGSAAEAAEVAALTRFHPLGRRGLAPMVRHLAAVGGDFTRLNERLAVIVQVEGAGAVDEVDAIAAVAGIDGVFVGPYDLSQSLGVPGELDHPRVLEAGARVARAVREPVALGVYVPDAPSARHWRQLGATFFTHATDGQLFLAAGRAARESWDAAVG